MRAADVELGGGADVVPRELETEALEALDHLARTGLAIAFLHVRPVEERGGYGIGQPGQQVALAVGIATRQLDAGEDRHAVLAARGLRLGDAA